MVIAIALSELKFRRAHHKNMPIFYIVKLGFTGVYIIFLISAQKHRLRVLVRTAIYVLSINMKKISELFYLKIFWFWR